MYEKEIALLNRPFKVTREEKIKGCKMKVGDILTVLDYGSGMACHIVKFTNNRLPRYIFTAGTWLFKSMTKGGDQE